MRRGSLTVEASLLMPLILTVIFAVLYLAFYLHDRTVLEAAAYQTAVRGSRLEGTSAEIENMLYQEGQQIAAERLFGSRITELSIRANTDRIEVEYQADFAVGPARGWKIRASQSAGRNDPVEFIRSCRRIGGWIEK